MPSRNINDLHPITREKVKCFLEEAKRQGIEVLITCTYRSPEEQEVLYMQGRLRQFEITLEELNEKRKRLGLYPLSKEEANRIVTNARAWQSFHQYGLAIDVVPLNGGKPDWNNLQAFEKLGEIGQRCGLEWAGTWQRFKEYPHFQDTETYTLMVNKGAKK